MLVHALVKKVQKSKSKRENRAKTKRQNDVNYLELQAIPASYKQETVETFVNEEANSERQPQQGEASPQDGSSFQYDIESKSVVSSRDRCIMVMCAISLLSFSFITGMMSMVSLTFNLKYPFIFDSTINKRIINSILIGELIGMLFLGLISRFIDKLTMSIVSSGISFVGTAIATASQGSTTHKMFWMMSICLGVAGFGLGGQMVSAATLLIKAVNNYKTSKKRARVFILCSNLPLISGLFISCLVYFVTWRATGQGQHLATSWRVVFGIGAVFPVITLISSLIMKFTFKGYEGTRPQWVPLRTTTIYYRKRLLATSCSWFIYGFIYFPTVPYLGFITQTVLQATSVDSTSQWSLLMSALAIPGVFLGSRLVKWTTQRALLLFGFAVYFVLGLVLGCGYTPIVKIIPLFMIFYGLFKSLGNAGPGNMTILYSCELYADCIRGLFFAISAASGTVGSIVGFNVYQPIIKNIGIRWFYIISALISIIGFVSGFLFLPKVSEDDIDNENLVFEEYLKSIQN
ncbi:unnamed protein product [[Candida] boidinii]|uniref:Unnamed protein product n=1 Tax=Candida boidinii TaxID=5477 RepID=A0A9W6T0X1_CANBO|nr:transporter activity protein [[Candida] boidinii]GME72909.1 unnamed protein product [[Candida] boidinii]GMG12575.1 unnamed protein product [[Candida] boidinii]